MVDSSQSESDLPQHPVEVDVSRLLPISEVQRVLTTHMSRNAKGARGRVSKQAYSLAPNQRRKA